MEKKFSLKETIKNIQTGSFALNCAMPIEYRAGLPILKIVNNQLCVVIPFLKYKITGEVDKTQVFPVMYTITASLPTGKIVGFEDLRFNPEFAGTDFSTPVGLFRHDAIKNLNKEAYNNLRKELYAGYDKIVNYLTNNGTYTVDDENCFKSLLNTILEPSLRPFYQALDTDFANKYINQNPEV